MFNLLFKSSRADTISPAEVKKHLEENQAILLDVRTPEEHRNIHIPKSTLLPLDQIETKANQLLKDKNKEIIVYCHSGMRARSAAKKLKTMGYTQVKNLGGIIHWPYETVSK